MRGSRFAACFAAACLALVDGGCSDGGDEPPRRASATTTRAQLREEMRALWTDHAACTRFFLVASIADLPDEGVALGRLLRTPAEIGDAFRPFYGDATADELTTLLQAHIVFAAQVVAMARAPSAAREAVELPGASVRDIWALNADAIARLLARENPQWDESTLRDMTRAHVENVEAQASARLHEDWDADVAAYDEGLEQLLQLADVLSDGLVAQFPDGLGGS